LITGGAGFLGINLARQLLSRDSAVRTLDIAPFDYPEIDRVDAMLGDIRDADRVEQAMAGIQVVIHCAAALPLAPADEIRTTSVEGTRVLLDAALRHGVSRFVFVSSTAVYGVPDHVPIHEDHALRGVGPYGESKIAAERLCEQYRARGLCVSVLRPKTFVGPERLGAFELLYDWADDARNFPVLGRGDNLYQLLDVSDLCEVIVLCMTLAPSVVSDTFNVGAADFGTMRENFQAVLDRAGHGGRVIGLPAAPARFTLRLLEWLKLSPLYPWIYETADHDSTVSIERLSSRLGFRPRYSNREALVRNYDWYVAHRAQGRVQAGTSHRRPWKRGALRLVKYVF